MKFVCVISVFLLLFFVLIKAKKSPYQDLYKKFHLEGCDPGYKNNDINTDRISFFKFKTKPQWVSLSTESRVVFSDCFHNQIPSSWKNIYFNSSSVVYLKKKVNGAEFLHYRISYKTVRNSEDETNNQSFVELLFREVELGKNFTQNFVLIDRDFNLKLYCLKSAFATITEGHGFAFCGELKNDTLWTWLIDWKDVITKSKSTKSRKFVITLVSTISGMMVSCILCCLCCNCWKSRMDAKKGIRRRRGSNLSSSARTKEIEV
ncbi:UNVERIFIED_CONTAM: hypothetical protein RMT77_001466 [Armadillidium vulgare]